MYRGFGFTLPDLAAAITRMEGSCASPSNCRNNNPGNLRAYAAGQPVDSRGIRIFPSYQDGYNALLSQEQINIGKGLTLAEFFAGKTGVYPGYAPASDNNNPAGYTSNVSNWLGIPRDVPLSSLVGGSNVSQPGSTSADVVWPVAGVSDSSQPWLTDTFVSADGEGLSGSAWLGLGLLAAGITWAVVA